MFVNRGCRRIHVGQMDPDMVTGAKLGVQLPDPTQEASPKAQAGAVKTQLDCLPRLQDEFAAKYLVRPRVTTGKPASETPTFVARTHSEITSSARRSPIVAEVILTG